MPITSKKKNKYSVKQYAELKNVTVDAVYKAIHSNRVSFEKIGNTYIVIDS